MECTNHTERAALVTCRSCGKPLCLECAVDFDGAFSCYGECETATCRLLEAVHRSERKTKRIAVGAMALLCLLGAFACFGIAAKDIWTTQRASMDEYGDFHVDPPITAKVTKTEKVGYVAGGVLLFVGGSYGLVATVRLK